MEHKLLLVEGLPGTGKTTTAKRIAQYLQQRCMDVHLFSEGDLHPADLSWQAIIARQELDAILAPYQAFREAIDRQTQLEGDHAIIAYTKVETEDYAFYEAMAQYEIYDGKVPLDRFRALHEARWTSFAQQASQRDQITIFECAFLQNHVNALMQYYCLDEAAIGAHLRALGCTVRPLSPLLLYLSQPDTSKTIDHVAQERVSPHGNWIDSVIDYMETSPYGKQHGRKGLTGTIQGFSERKQIELNLLPTLPFPAHIINHENGD